MTQAAAKTKKIFDGRYEILSIVGRGGRSVVYHARTVAAPNSEVALKVLLDQKGKSTSGERLRKEALALVSSRHRHVIRLDDFHSVGSLCYLSMEFAPEADLRRYLGKLGRPIPIDMAENYLLQIAEALSFVHKAGIVHRDVKPDNILVLSDKEVRLGDFGVAVLPGESASLEELQAGVGTMNYLAPEVLEGKGYDHRADLYALAVSFYEILTGTNPFTNASIMKQLEVRKDENVPAIRTLRSDIPEYLAAVLTQAMSFDSRQRFESVRDFIQAILVNKAAYVTPGTASKVVGTILPKNSFQKFETHTAPAASSTGVADTIVAPPLATAPVEKPVDPAIAATQVIERDAKAAAEVAKQADPSPIAAPQGGSSEEPGSTQAVPAKNIGAATAPAPEAANIAVSQGVTQTVVAPPLSKKDLKKISQKVTPITKNPAATKETQAEVSDVTQTTFIDKKSIDQLRTSRKEKKAPVPTGIEPLQPKKTGRLGFIAIAGFLCGVVFILVPGIYGAVKKYFPATAQTAEVAKQAAQESGPQSPIPTYTASNYVFPALPGGLYTGSISELIPGRNLPLAFVSLDSQDELVVMVGLEGWTPVAVKPRARMKQASTTASIPLRITSSGFILEFTGQTVDGELFGYFKNLVTGNQGEWRARPIGLTKNKPTAK